MAKCATEVCNQESTVRVYWPGQTRDMCSSCGERAMTVAKAMGFNIDVIPIPEGFNDGNR